ncbi:MAG: hypothetical protein HY402_03955 [Elusimicrobia bacterium]|nr:hypothetical protein [Elusimicrobiota bacterium]
MRSLLLVLFITFLSLLSSARHLLGQKFEPILITTSPVFPTFLAHAEGLHDFGLFADGGWDGNWYVGFNTCWIVAFPQAPGAPREYRKAFLGARLGRAKTENIPGRPPWEKRALAGKIYIGVSSTPAWTTAQSFFLAEAQDIPIEPDPANAVLGAGHSEWFWREVPLKMIHFDQPNYLALWSPTPYFTSASSAPILAAARVGKKEFQAWLNRSIEGVPPRSPEKSLETPLSYFAPALAIKLVPLNASPVLLRRFEARSRNNSLELSVSVLAENPEWSWIELSEDGIQWKKFSEYRRHPPYRWSLPLALLPRERFFLRAAAQDLLGNTGYSTPLILTPGQP